MAFMNPFTRLTDFLWKEWFQNCDFFEEKNVFMHNETFIVIFRHYVKCECQCSYVGVSGCCRKNKEIISRSKNCCCCCIIQPSTTKKAHYFFSPERVATPSNTIYCTVVYEHESLFPQYSKK